MSPFIGIVLIVGSPYGCGFCIRGGQVTAMKKDLKELRKLQEENQRREIEKERNEALKKRDDLNSAPK